MRVTRTTLAICALAALGLITSTSAARAGEVDVDPTRVRRADASSAPHRDDLLASTNPNDAAMPPPTTSPATPGNAAAGDERPELEALSAALGVPLDEVSALIDYQGRVHDLLDPQRNEPWFVDFAFRPQVAAGTLLVERGAELPSSASDAIAEIGIDITVARLDPSQRSELIATAEAIAVDVFGEALAVVDYLPIEDSLRVWLRPGATTDPALAEAVVERIVEVDPSLREVTVDEVPGEGARGGQYADHATTTEWCTTSFGIWAAATSAYLMAGHCGIPLPNFVINGNAQSGFSNRLFTGYQDRQAIFAGGASFWTRISASLEVDMASTAGHIYMNDVVCRYGQTSNNLMCGAINNVNQPVNHWNGNIVLATVTGGATCQGGDSGGPVWLPTIARNPVGLISGITYSGSYCMYVALDDQLAGTGWSLL